MAMKHRLALTAMLVAGCLWAAWRLLAGSGAVTAQPAQPASACTLQVGQQWAYTARSESRFKVDLAAVMGGNATLGPQQLKEMAVTMTWRLTLSVAAATADDALVIARWSDVRAEGRDKTVTTGDDLRHPAALRINRSCQITAVSRHKDSADSAARTQQAALLALSFRLPLPGADAGPDTIDTAIGRCRAQHTARSDGDDIEVTQRLLDCNSVRGAPQLHASTANGHAVFQLDGGPWLSAVAANRHIVLRSATHWAVQMQSKLDVQRAPAPTQQPPAVNPGHFVWKLVTAVPTEGQVAARQWPGLAGMSAKDALAEIIRTWNSNKDGTMAARQFARAWLQANPDGASQLLVAIRDGEVDGAVAAALYHVIGRFGGDKTRAALRSVLGRGDFSDGDRSRAALAMAALPDAGMAEVNALLQASKRTGDFAEKGTTVGHSATLALGMLSHERRAQAPELADAINEHLRLASQLPDEGLAAEALSAIGNTGDPALLDAINEQLGHGSEDLRAKAGSALRLMDPDASAKLLVATLTKERSERVIEKLADAAAMAQMLHKKAAGAKVVAAADKALQQATAAATKRALVQMLGAAGDNAAAKKALKAAFERGADLDTLRLIGTHMSADELMPP